MPHTERANTANFLEELVDYVQRLQRRVVELEQQLGLAPSVQLPARAITFSGEAPDDAAAMPALGRTSKRVCAAGCPS